MDTSNKYVLVLKHHWRFAAILFLIVVAAVYAFTYTSPKVYEVAADLYVAPKPITITGNSYVFANYEYQMLNNQIEILRSDEVAEEAAKAINDVMAQPATPTKPFQYKNYGISMGYLQGALRVQKQDNASILDLQFTGTPLRGNPEELRVMLNTYLDTYKDYMQRTNSAKAHGEREFLAVELTKAEQDLNDQAKALQDFQGQNKAYNIDTQTSNLLTQQNALVVQNQTIASDIAATSQEINASKKVLSTTPQYINYMSRIDHDTELGKLRDGLIDLEQKKADMATKITSAHPQMKALNDQITKMNALIQQRLSTFGKVYAKEAGPTMASITSSSTFDVDTANSVINDQIKLETMEARRNAAVASLAQIGNSLSSLPEKQLTFAELKSKFDMAQDKYTLLQKRLDEAQILEEVSKLDRVEVIKNPAYPAKIRPDWNKNLTAGVMLGLCFALFAVFVRASLDKTLLWPFQLQGVTDDNPITANSAVFHLPSLPSKAACSQMLEKTNFSVPEPYKRLIIHLENLSKKEQVRRIGVIPISPFGECNITTIALGLYLTELSNKMVLIDTDYSNYSLTRLIGSMRLPMSGGIESGPGLSDYLNGDVDDFVDIIYPLGKTVYGSFIPAGRPIHEAGFQFSHKNLGQLEANLSPNYNFVLYSLSSLEKSFDSIAVSRTLDGVLLLVHPGVTMMDQVSNAIAELESIGCPLLGLLFQPID